MQHKQQHVTYDDVTDALGPTSEQESGILLHLNLYLKQDMSPY